MSDLADIVIRVDSSQLNSAAGATAELRRSTLNLISSVDRVAAAQLSHANSMRVLQSAVNAGILSQQEMNRTAASLTQRLEAQGLTINHLGQVVQRNTGIFRRFGSSGMQQVGYQVGDFAVQVQGGTSALVALGQQGSQLLGVFGAGGAIAGAFLAIGTALLNAYTNAKKFKDASGNLKTAISDLRGQIELLQSGAQGITKEFGNITTGLERTVRLIATVSLANAFKEARTQLAALTRDLYTSTATIMKSTIWAQTTSSAEDYQKNFGMSQGQSYQMADMELALARATSDKERLALLDKMNVELSKQVSSGAIISEQGYAYLNSMALAQQGLQTVVNLQRTLADTSAASLETQRQNSNIIASRNAAEEASVIQNRIKLEALTRQREEYLAQLGYIKDTANAQDEAQRMLNGGLSVAGGLNRAAILDKQQELRAAKELEASLVVAYGIYAKTRVEAESTTKAMSSAYGFFAKTRTEGESLAKAAERAGVSATQLSHIAFSNISSAANEALRLAGNLGISLDTATKLAAMGDQGIPTDPSGKTYSGRGNMLPTAEDRYSMQYGYTTPPKDGKKGGGGAGAITTLENKLEEIYKYLEADKYLIEQEAIAYEQRQDTLEDALKKKIISIEEYNQIEKDLKIRHEQSLSEIEQNAQRQRLSDMGNFFGSLASIAEFGGKKSAKAVATFQAIEGTINAYGAAIKALNTPGISLPGRFAAYASVLAAGLKGVSAIRAAGGVGGGSEAAGGGRGSATVPTTTAQATPQTVYIDSISPENLYTGQTLINLFDAFYSENDKRGKVFVVGK